MGGFARGLPLGCTAQAQHRARSVATDWAVVAPDRVAVIHRHADDTRENMDLRAASGAALRRARRGPGRPRHRATGTASPSCCRSIPPCWSPIFSAADEARRRFIAAFHPLRRGLRLRTASSTVARPAIFVTDAATALPRPSSRLPPISPAARHPCHHGAGPPARPSSLFSTTLSSRPSPSHRTVDTAAEDPAVMTTPPEPTARSPRACCTRTGLSSGTLPCMELSQGFFPQAAMSAGRPTRTGPGSAG